MTSMNATILLLHVLAVTADEPASQVPKPPPAASSKKSTAPPDNQRRRVFLPSDPRDDAAILAEDAQIPRETKPTGPTAQLSLFGNQKAEGRSFVLLIDRSAS